MAKKARAGLSHEQKARLWARWKAGECVSDIARALEVPGSRVHHVLACTGGMVPAKRCRSSRALRMEEREEISRGIAAGDSVRRIAARLRRAQSPANSLVTADVTRIGRVRRMYQPGNERSAPNDVVLRRIASYDMWWPAASVRNGRQSRSRAG